MNIYVLTEIAYDMKTSHRPNINIHCLLNNFITVLERIGMTPNVPQCMSCQDVALSNKMRSWEGPGGIVIWSDVHPLSSHQKFEGLR